MRILIDGDACPVVESIVHLTEGTGFSVLIYRSYDHFSYQDYPQHVSVKYVDGGRDAVDFAIVQNVTSHDIVITQDYGLASLVLNKANYVLHHNGHLYTSQNIDQLLAQRYYSQQERRKSNRYGKGPKAFNTQQRQFFIKQLHTLIQKVQNETQ